MHLTTPLALGSRTAPNRVMFGPHVTNLGDDNRALPDRWVRYLAARAAGGCGIIVGEGASVHPSDWPYERAPLATEANHGWAAAAAACHQHGALFIAGLDHAGGQGSSAYNQRELWAPSRVPEVNSREVPKWMEAEDITLVVQAFGQATKAAVAAGCDGIEINAGQHSLIRQFLSGLTNHRGDEWGQDRLLLARQVIVACKQHSADTVVGLRLSCDELAPWAGITPEMAPDIAAQLAACGLDYLVVVRGSIFSIEKTRPDFHEPTGFNIDLCRNVRQAVQQASPHTKVFLQGSIVEWGQAEWAIGDGICDGVEMTRAQIADPHLVAKLVVDTPEQIRPCLRCNQTCQVRDARNPIVTCVGEPSSGHETTDPNWLAPAIHRRNVAVVGGGIAGLEAARIAAIRGHRVHLLEQSPTLGGVAAVTGPGGPLVQWLISETQRLGVQIHVNSAFHDSNDSADTDAFVIQATGGQPGARPFQADPNALVLDIVDVRSGAALLPEQGVIAIFDPIGGPIAVSLAQDLGPRAVLITQDNIAGNELSRTGDLAPANVRLAQHNVQVERRSILRSAHIDHVVLEDRFNGSQRDISCVALVDCGFRLPTPALATAQAHAGDCVAPRTILEAILEARRAVMAADH